MMVKHLVATTSILTIFFSPAILAQNARDGFECNPMPIPARPVGPSVHHEWSYFDQAFGLTAWRFPCSEDFSFVIVTIEPRNNEDPFICSSQVIAAQGESTLDDSPLLTQDPFFNHSSWCSSVVLPTSFALVPRNDESPVDYQQAFTVHWDLLPADQQFEMFAYDPSQYEVFGDETFRINEGLSDAWYNPSTDGQGFFMTIYPDAQVMFLSWFTFDTDRPPQDVMAHLGDPGARWLTAQGPYSGNKATLDVTLTTGGVFNNGVPAPSNSMGGTLTVEFDDCYGGTVEFDIPSISQKGVVPIERISLDQVPLCQQLDGVTN